MGNNPIRYIDPDGKIRVDSNGKIKFEITSISQPHYTTTGHYKEKLDKSYSGILVCRIFASGYIFANDGTKIEVHGLELYDYVSTTYYIDGNHNVVVTGKLNTLRGISALSVYDPTENCHGYTFAKDYQLNIDNGQISKLLAGDGYRLVGSYKTSSLDSSHTMFRQGLADIVIFYLEGEVIHSARISGGTYSDNAGIGLRQEGKSNINGAYSASRGMEYDKVEFYRSPGNTKSNGNPF